MPLSAVEEEECIHLLKHSVLFKECTHGELKKLSRLATKRQHKKGDVLCREGEPQTKFYLMSEGQIVREKSNATGEVHRIDTYLGHSTVGSLHVPKKDPAYATSVCITDVTAYEIEADDLIREIKTNPDFYWNVVCSLTLEVRRHTRAQRTPLLEQHGKKPPIFAISLAASIESFYRSALNSLLNQALTGVRATTLFPNMHIQLPTRVMYINGFKLLRQYFDVNIKPEEYSNPTAVRLAAAITPGIIMTPVSSILEACNAGHANPEALYTRWMRGIVPRCGREVIFGVGLNQLSDWYEERVPDFDFLVQYPALKNALGSMAAGVTSGYLSHVVHNMSTLKLMNPNKTYRQHFREYVNKSEARVPTNLPPTARSLAKVFVATVFPTGVMIRTSQIVGSFIILNGIIGAVSRYDIKNKDS
eukprot:TRINITY_DN10468_c0_g1_i1.p1 TRINITY_DN10468_c0_g1~~TRINITY_DN10468_c0_g1_i1.p1  ORF type:complete len:418 (-),score=94.22 TRINITY_DN10468_c0_g1_i1:34-1287(-)